MSANAACLPCPICLHTGVFNTAQSLKDRLIFVSTNNILCPICQEEVSGLDKLTIHLFSHINIAPTQHPPQRNENIDIRSVSKQPTKPTAETQKKTKVTTSKNKPLSPTPITQMKFVKIYPKLPVIALNTMPIIDITPNAEGETPYACTQCNKTFTFQQSYHKHLLYHNDEKPHTCSFCGRAFKELSTLHNHQRIHTGEKPFACETCGKCFRQRVSYLVHRRIHTGVMPYKCTACDKSFRYKVSQRTHKCQVQPPGTVVRQTGEFVEKLKKKKESDDPTLKSNEIESQNGKFEHTKYPEISEVNAELVRTGAQLSLEDMESENFTILSEAFGESNMPCSNYSSELPRNATQDEKTVDIISNIDELIESIPANEKSIPSPSDIFKKLCLSNEEEFFGVNQDSDLSYEMNKDINDYL
ncbi:zinc finger protein 271 isoform X3 [Pararge aegeria]|uniref:zinc finger protein 271 isoform X3 n=1 Tax=Pararge aegeria TaxID=116150 RepID=UPI0019D08794|nr:zinc finger protein 271 isoform X3 [Pararge aegeria]